MQMRRKFTTEFKEEAARLLGLGVSVAEVAKACEVNPNVLHRWRREIQHFGLNAFRRQRTASRRRGPGQVGELERKVGLQALEVDFWRRCFQHVQEQQKLRVDFMRLVDAYFESELRMASRFLCN
jgi:transposase-like protein